MFQNYLGMESDEGWDKVRIAEGEPMPSIESIVRQYQGVVLTGSRFNVRERAELPWFDSLISFIRQAADRGRPRVYGGCFGHQCIAFALGGCVDYNPLNKFILRNEEIRLLPSFHELLVGARGAVEEKLKIIVSHGDCVTTLPPDSILLAYSDSCAYEMFVVGKEQSVLACQSHPEFSYEYCVQDRIWPSVVEINKKLSEAEIAVAKHSFERCTRDQGADQLCHIISSFLRRPFEDKRGSHDR